MNETIHNLLGADDPELPTSSSLSRAVLATTLEGLGAAGIVFGLVFGAFVVMAGPTTVVVVPLPAETAALGFGVGGGVLFGASLLVRWTTTGDVARPVPTLTAITAETPLLMFLIVLFTPGPLSLPVVITAAALTVPIGVFYRGWLWTRFNALDRALLGKWYSYPHYRTEGTSQIIFWIPVGLVYLTVPAVGIGVLWGLLGGHLVVRSYRDIVVPLHARRSSIDFSEPVTPETSEPAPSSVPRSSDSGSGVRSNWVGLGLWFLAAPLIFVWFSVWVFFYDSQYAPPLAETRGIETLFGFDPGAVLLVLGGIIVCLVALGYGLIMLGGSRRDEDEAHD